jgi:hypothetical protein
MSSDRVNPQIADSPLGWSLNKNTRRAELVDFCSARPAKNAQVKNNTPCTWASKSKWANKKQVGKRKQVSKRKQVD